MNRAIGAGVAGLGLVTAVLMARGMRLEGDGGKGQAALRSGKRTPVVVELFTSEGCSSCPAADQVLAQLQKDQPLAGVEIIPLSEHVDYWNYIGWADPFSSSVFSERQRGYGSAFRLDSVYTPQMVVNGQAEFVGSDRNRAEATIARAGLSATAEVEVRAGGGRKAEGVPPGISDRVDRTDRIGYSATSGPVVLRVRVDKLTAVRRGDTADVVLAVTEDHLRSKVARGENAGRSLAHTAVVREMRMLGSARPGQEFTANPTVALETGWKRSDLRAVVFVQERISRRVLGAGQVSLTAAVSE